MIEGSATNESPQQPVECTPKRPDFHHRYATALLLAALVSLPAVIWGAVRAYHRTDNSIDQWLPKDGEATDAYNHFRQLFGSDEAVLVSWIGCTLEDPRLEQFAQIVEERSGLAPQRSDSTEPNPSGSSRSSTDSQQASGTQKELARIENIMTGQRAYRELRSPLLNISRDVALHRLQGVLVGPDQRTTCAIVSLATQTARERASAVTALKRIAVQECHVPAADLRLTGDAVISVGIDTEGDEAVDRWVWLSALLALGVAWACLKSMKLALLVFLLSQFCQGIAEAIVHYTGGSMNLLVAMVPVLIYVLAVSASVHLLNYYRDAVQDVGPVAAPRKALEAGWFPCCIATITTAMGLASLCVSRVLPVRHFGLYASVGVLVSFVVLILLLPAATVKFPAVPPSANRRRSAGARTAYRAHFLVAIAEWISRKPCLVIVSFALIFVVLGAGLFKVKTSVEPVRFLPKGSRWITDMQWYQEHIGPLASVEVVLGFNNDCTLEFADRMRLIRAFETRATQLDSVQGTVSCATFAPSLGPFYTGPMSLREQVRRSVADWAVLEHRDDFIEGRFLAEDGEWELWRITARVTSFADLDYEQFVQASNTEVRKIIDAAQVSQDAVQITYTGGIPLIYAAQRELLHALFVSFTVALGLVTLVMAIILRNPVAGILAMAPNIFPALATFGTMGWLGALVDVGAMMTASIGLGVAVDDTLHFVTWFRRACRGGASRIEAVHTAYQSCAAAMLHTTLIAGLALFVFYFSSFQPVSQFGLLMFLLLAAALVGDLLLLPAILASKAGVFFETSGRIRHTTATCPADECPK